MIHFFVAQEWPSKFIRAEDHCSGMTINIPDSALKALRKITHNDDGPSKI